MEGHISITISRDLFSKLDAIRSHQERTLGVDLSWNDFLKLALPPISEALGDVAGKKAKGGR